MSSLRSLPPHIPYTATAPATMPATSYMPSVHTNLPALKPKDHTLDWILGGLATLGVLVAGYFGVKHLNSPKDGALETLRQQNVALEAKVKSLQYDLDHFQKAAPVEGKKLPEPSAWQEVDSTPAARESIDAILGDIHKQKKTSTERLQHFADQIQMTLNPKADLTPEQAEIKALTHADTTVNPVDVLLPLLEELSGDLPEVKEKDDIDAYARALNTLSQKLYDLFAASYGLEGGRPDAESRDALHGLVSFLRLTDLNGRSLSYNQVSNSFERYLNASSENKKAGAEESLLKVLIRNKSISKGIATPQSWSRDELEEDRRMFDITIKRLEVLRAMNGGLEEDQKTYQADLDKSLKDYYSALRALYKRSAVEADTRGNLRVVYG